MQEESFKQLKQRISGGQRIPFANGIPGWFEPVEYDFKLSNEELSGIEFLEVEFASFLINSGYYINSYYANLKQGKVQDNELCIYTSLTTDNEDIDENAWDYIDYGTIQAWLVNRLEISEDDEIDFDLWCDLYWDKKNGFTFGSDVSLELLKEDKLVLKTPNQEELKELIIEAYQIQNPPDRISANMESFNIDIEETACVYRSSSDKQIIFNFDSQSFTFYYELS